MVTTATKKIGKDNEVRTCFTITRETDEQIKTVILFLRKKRMAALRAMIEEAAASRESITDIRNFYYRSEYEDSSESALILARFNCSHLADELLASLCMEIFGLGKSRNKKSRMMRVLSTYYARRLRPTAQARNRIASTPSPLLQSERRPSAA